MFIRCNLFLTLLTSYLTIVSSQSANKPHIIFILADDLGWNDVGFHGSNQFPTPNIDALAYSGVILNRYYVTPICTPSRSALMTGKYPIHNGMQHTVLFAAEPRGLPLNQTILPEYLKQQGYATHIVGKWHLGHYRREYTPLYRGFDSHFGFWTGHQDAFDHTAVEKPYWGLDMRENMEPAWSSHGIYNTELFTQRACRRIREHNTSEPMFLYVAHAAVHSGNPYDPLRAPDSSLKAVSKIEDLNRWRFAAMMHQLDLSVGSIVTTLKEKEMLSNSIIIFSTDNGGAAAGFNLNAASNWPLRGVKNTLWEGGVRGVGLIWSPLLTNPGRISNQLIHISDWLPTLIGRAGLNSNDIAEDNLDGMDVWSSISEDAPSPRTQILHNIDDIYGNAALTNQQWKLLKGSTYKGAWDGWYGPSGRNENGSEYNWSMVLKSAKRFGITLDLNLTRELRTQAQVECSNIETKNECSPLISPCLFNIDEDPCEMNNLADIYPDILEKLMDQLNVLNETAVTPSNLPWDPKANPKFWDHTWTNFGDHI